MRRSWKPALPLDPRMRDMCAASCYGRYLSDQEIADTRQAVASLRLPSQTTLLALPVRPPCGATLGAAPSVRTTT